MKLYSLILLLLSSVCLGQTFSGGTGTLTDNGTKSFNCAVSGLPTTLSNSFGLESICFSISHANVSDLDVKLVAPDGVTTYQLFKSIGGTGDNFTNTCLNMNASSYIMTGSAPFTGSFKPQEDLGIVNIAQNPNGTWKLRIKDQVSGTGGSISFWSLTFSNTPAVFSSNLPILVLNSGTSVIMDDPKVMADLKVARNASGRNYMNGPYEYEGKIGIELRGSSSSGFPKKSYGFETWDINGMSIDTNLLGLPAESDWALIANYTDKGLMNNMLAYNLYNDMGHYAPGNRYCEVILNKSYKGVYLLTEKIKRDSNRVSIAKLLPIDTVGNELTGGYIIKIDKPTGSAGGGWTSGILSPAGTTISFQYEYPNVLDIHPKQEAYIQAVMNGFENTLNGPNYNHPTIGYRNYFKLRGLLDYFILNEVSRNVDGLRISTYLYKEKSTDGNKLSFIPWDYDIAFGNADYCDGWRTDDWSYTFPTVCPGDGSQVPFWWDRFMQDSAFKADLKCRFEYLRSTILSTPYLHHYIDSVATVLDEAQTRNFNTYPILGQYVWPNPSPIPTNYAGEITELKSWLSDRLDWLDANLPGTCIMTSLDPRKNPVATSLRASPNPLESSSLVAWESEFSQELKIRIVNSFGQLIFEKQITTHVGENIFQVNLENQDPGIYFLNLHNDIQSQSIKLIRK